MISAVHAAQVRRTTAAQHATLRASDAAAAAADDDDDDDAGCHCREQTRCALLLTTDSTTILSHWLTHNSNRWQQVAYGLRDLYINIGLVARKRRCTQDFYRAACINCLSRESSLSVCPPACQTRDLWQKERKICPYFYTIRKIIYPSFLRRRMVDRGDPFQLKFCFKLTPVGAKSPIFSRYSLVAPQR